ncbi:MAG TPA: rod shape-determining protein RodA [Gemmatimonadales bacterium]|nr:rod shape-determining protein RodA [Gemmatimonadales bacterium]
MFGRLDRPLTAVTLALTAYGILILYSAGQTDVPTSVAHIWQRQLVWFALSITAALLVMRVSPRLLEWAAPGCYAGGIVVLLVTLVIGTGGGTAASSHSWITIGGQRLGQPSEFVKLVVILMLARHLASLRAPPRNLRELVVPCLIALVPAALVAIQPDLGSALVFGGVLFAMLYWAGVRLPFLVLLGSPLASLVLAFSPWTWGGWIVLLSVLLVVWRPFVWEGLAVLGANLGMGIIALPLWHRLAAYQQHRFLSFLNPDIDPRATGWHIIQSKIAIGSGGWLGKGFTMGSQKRLAFLPAQHTDFIFSVVGEELGFLGVLVALALFFALLAILIRVARRSPDPFGSLVAFGVIGVLFTHIFENIGMTANVMPITGIPLPFFSYGGSFLLACFLGVGMAMRVAREGRELGYHEL